MNNFVVANPNKCIGCRTCEIACVVAHSDKNIFLEDASKIEFNPRLTVVKTAQVSAPIQCRQCEDAPCANACPNGSIVNKEGIIYVDQETCIGCKTCVIACPFGAMDLTCAYKNGEKVLQQGLKTVDASKLCFKEKIIAHKCDLCIGREGGPACVEICPTNAFKIVKASELDQSVEEKRKNRALELFKI